MDWDLKMPLWDMSELEGNAAPSMGSVVQPSERIDCSVDLKLGGLGDFGSYERLRENPRAVPTMAGSSSKRARAPGSCGQKVSCLVDGCKADLSNCREYHKRHKVCEVHSKTPIVMVGGQEQRFCQQCSRFHLLVEFDEVKRSCRKRLDGHNRRRRKPQPESFNSRNFFQNHQGGRLSYPQVFPSATFEPSWAGIAKTEEDVFYSQHSLMHLFNKQQNFPGSSRGYKEGRQIPFFQDGSDFALGSRVAPEPPICKPLHKAHLPVESISSSRMFSVLNSDYAPSLLSSPTQTSGSNLGQMVQADRISMGQPLDSSLHYSGLGHFLQSQSSNIVSKSEFSCSGIEDDRVNAGLVSDASDTDIRCQGIFQVSGERSSDKHTEAFPFSWQ